MGASLRSFMVSTNMTIDLRRVKEQSYVPITPGDGQISPADLAIGTPVGIYKKQYADHYHRERQQVPHRHSVHGQETDMLVRYPHEFNTETEHAVTYQIQARDRHGRAGFS